MRCAILFLTVLIAGCTQSDRRKTNDTPVVTDHPTLAQRLRLHEHEWDERKAAKDATAETTVDGVVAR